MNYDKSVNVVYCSSDSFSEVCAVSIVSLFENNKHLDEIMTIAHVLEDRISDKNKQRLPDMAKRYGRSIILVSMSLPLAWGQRGSMSCGRQSYYGLRLCLKFWSCAVR